MKPIRLAMILLVVVSALVVHRTSASCASPGLIGTRSSSDHSFVWTEDVFAAIPLPGGGPYVYDLVPPVTPQFQISFWALGLGDPTSAAGIDNGTFNPVTDFYFRSNYYNGTNYYYGGELFSSWAHSGVDGCPEANQCLGFLFEDENGQRGSFALVTAQTDQNLSASLAQPNSAPIVLVPVDAPVVLDLQGSLTGIQLETVVPTPAGGGTYPLDGCPAVLQGNIYAQTVPAGDAAPTDRDRSLWTLISPAPGATPPSS